MNKKNLIPTEWANDIDFNDDDTKQGGNNLISADAINALAAGEGARPIGAGGKLEIVPNIIFKLCKVDFKQSYMWNKDKISDISEQDYNSLPQDDPKREQFGVLRKWFTFITDSKDLSFSRVLGEVSAYNTDFWKHGDSTVTSDFDVTKVIKPTVRRPDMWVKDACKCLVGNNHQGSLINKYIRCVGVRNYTHPVYNTAICTAVWYVYNSLEDAQKAVAMDIAARPVESPTEDNQKEGENQ